MHSNFRVQVTFWGVRGSVPTPVPANLGYGGNTSCIEVRAQDGVQLIIDAGTGLRALGLSLTGESAARPDTHLFLTHFHWDHIQGLPFFICLYDPGSRVTIYSDREPEELRRFLEGQMTAPYFPVGLTSVPATWNFVRIGADPIRIGGVSARSFPLNHPQGGCGFRFEYEGIAVVHASDLEHGDDEMERILIGIARDADLLIYDAHFTPEEYPSRRGWGHSTWLDAVRIARAARVKRLVLFHHDPSRDDRQIDEMVALAREHFAATEAAREGSSITL